MKVQKELICLTLSNKSAKFVDKSTSVTSQNVYNNCISENSADDQHISVQCNFVSINFLFVVFAFKTHYFI